MKNISSDNLKNLFVVFKDSLKVFGPIGAISGFISDIITPIAPIIDYLAIGLLAVTFILSILFFVKRRSENKGKLISFLPNSIILTVIIGAFSLMGFNTDNGFFGDNFESVNSIQSSIFNIEKGVNRIEGKVDNIQKDIGDIKSAVTKRISDIDERLYAIEKEISNGNLINNPSNLEEYLINAMITYNTANYKETELLLEKVFREGYIKYDLVQVYYDVLLNNYNADTERIRILMKNKDFAKNSNYFHLVDIENNLTGVKYYFELEKENINNKELQAFLENSKAKSFYTDVQYYVEEGNKVSTLFCKWTNKFVENKKILGLKILKAKSLFFNYNLSYKKYLTNTSYSNDDNAVFDFYAKPQNLEAFCDSNGKPQKIYIPKYPG